jgi:CheY-like chemotaxis protein
MEAETGMLPYYHPTTIILLDDDHAFLRSLSFSAIGDMLHVKFTRPDEALAFVHAQHRLLPRFETFVSSYDRSINVDVAHGDRLLRLRSGTVAALARNDKRFAVNSVVVVDYDMPAMNGLQFCRAIGNLPLRKLLLTGKAGTDVGVKALNDGIIDGYFVKQDAGLIDTLGAGIANQKQAFFTEITRPLLATLCLDDMSFLQDAAVADELAALWKDDGAVEYYSCCEPPGVLMVAADGMAKLVVVYDDSAIQAHAEIAREADAPKELVELLERRAIVPVFPNNSYYSEQLSRSWRQNVWPNNRLDGARLWHVGVVTSGDVHAALTQGCKPLLSYMA